MREFDGNERFDAYLFELPAFEHKALRPPRPNHEGEETFAGAWQQLHIAPEVHGVPPNAMLDWILTDFHRRITQRHATVLASVVCWLGTNGGRSFLSSAEAACLALKSSRGHGYRAAWSQENCRQRGIDDGVRLLESLLAPADHFGVHGRRGYCLLQFPQLSSDDYEVAEHLAVWLGTDGRDFVEDCQRRIEAVRQARRAADLTAWQRENGLTPSKAAA